MLYVFLIKYVSKYKFRQGTIYHFAYLKIAYLPADTCLVISLFQMVHLYVEIYLRTVFQS